MSYVIISVYNVAYSLWICKHYFLWIVNYFWLTVGLFCARIEIWMETEFLPQMWCLSSTTGVSFLQQCDISATLSHFCNTDHTAARRRSEMVALYHTERQCQPGKYFFIHRTRLTASSRTAIIKYLVSLAKKS